MSNPNTLTSRTRRSLTALAAAAVILLVAALTASAQTPAATKIAFDRGGNIYTMNPDGSNQTQISDIFGINPALSPDGKRVVFVCGAEPWDICTMNVDGTNFSVLTETRNNSNPTWSPDGSKIAFTSAREGDLRIYTMNADGTNVQRLVANDPTILSEDYATWSPDGTRVAFVGENANGGGIYAATVQGGAAVPVFSANLFIVNLAWSPDGTRIAFDTINDLYVVGADGSHLQLLASGPDEENMAPAWSPDSSKIAFYRLRILRDENGSVIGNEDGLYVMPATGGTPVSLNAPDSNNPSWSVVPTQDPGPKPEPTPAERINDLISRVKRLGLHHGITNSLVVKLQNALRALEAGDTAGACASLKAFANEVNAQSGKKLPAVQATQLTDDVNAIRAALGCS